MRPIGFLLVPLLSLGLLTGCGLLGSKKPQAAALQPFVPAVNVTVAWRADVGRTPKFEVGVGQFTPGVSGNSVYAASSAGTVSRIDISTGQLIWRTDVGVPIVAGVAVGSGLSDGFSAVVTERIEIVVIAADGKIAQRIATGGVILEPPVLMGNVVVARLADNRIAGWDIETGLRRWVLQRTLPTLVLHAQSGLTVAAREPEQSTTGVLGATDVLVNLPGARLIWLDSATGNVRWESQVVAPRGANEVERIADLLGSPTVHGPDVCVAAYQLQIACFSAENGRRIWGREFAVTSPLAASAAQVFATDSQSRLFAFNRTDGQTTWSTEAFQLRGLVNPLVAGRLLWVADQFGFLHALSTDNGGTLGRVSLDGSGLSGPMRNTQQGLVVQTQGGRLMLIRSEG